MAFVVSEKGKPAVIFIRNRKWARVRRAPNISGQTRAPYCPSPRIGEGLLFTTKNGRPPTDKTTTTGGRVGLILALGRRPCSFPDFRLPFVRSLVDSVMLSALFALALPLVLGQVAGMCLAVKSRRMLLTMNARSGPIQLFGCGLRTRPMFAGILEYDS
jgi:hypothetical protein